MPNAISILSPKLCTQNNLKFLAVILIFFLFVCEGSSETWGRIIDLPNSGPYVHSVRRTSNGGAIIGVIPSKVMMIDRDGQIRWQKDGLINAIETPFDNGFAAFGTRDNKWFIAKFDSSMNVVWQKTYSFTTSERVVFNHLRFLPDLGFVLLGSQYTPTGPRKCLLLRTDSTGQVLWMKRYPSFNVKDVEIMENQGIFLVGKPDVTVIRISFSGATLLHARYGNGNEDPVSIQPTPDQSLIVASNGGNYPTKNFVTKISTGGKILWRQSFQGDPMPYFKSIVSTREGFLVAATRPQPNGDSINVFLMQLDQNGIFQWDLFLGNSKGEHATAVATTDNHYLVAGGTFNVPLWKSQGFVIKFPRNKSAASTCSFRKNYEQPIHQTAILNMRSVLFRSLQFNNVHVNVDNSLFEILNSEIQTSDLCL